MHRLIVGKIDKVNPYFVFQHQGFTPLPIKTVIYLTECKHNTHYIIISGITILNPAVSLLLNFTDHLGICFLTNALF